MSFSFYLTQFRLMLHHDDAKMAEEYARDRGVLAAVHLDSRFAEQFDDLPRALTAELLLSSAYTAFLARPLVSVDAPVHALHPKRARAVNYTVTLPFALRARLRLGFAPWPQRTLLRRIKILRDTDTEVLLTDVDPVTQVERVDAGSSNRLLLFPCFDVAQTGDELRFCMWYDASSVDSADEWFCGCVRELLRTAGGLNRRRK